MEAFTRLPQSESHRLVPVSSVQIRPGIVPETWILVVQGHAPCRNMKVTLEPAVYIRQPEYWVIEVVGHLAGGICLPAIQEYTVVLPLSGTVGTRGIEVVGQDFRERFAVPPGPAADSSRIVEVNKVALAVAETLPPELLIHVEGTAATPGWGNPRLEPLADDLAEDGYAEFEFVADPPTGPVVQILVPISASLVWEQFGEFQDRLKGVRVFSSTNQVTTQLPGSCADTPRHQ